MVYDCIVIGGGIGGLTAAIYLARFNCTTCVIDNDDSRASLITLSKNYPGFANGISGNELLRRLKEQYKFYQHKTIKDTAIQIKKFSAYFTVKGKRTSIQGKNIILATGVIDKEPAIPNLTKAIKCGLIRHCLICDGYEASGKKIVVLGNHKKCLNSAYLLREYSTDVTLINVGKPFALSAKEKTKLKIKPIKIMHQLIVQASIKKNQIKDLKIDNTLLDFDIIYSALGVTVRSELAIKLGAKHNKEGSLIVNAHQETNIPGLYAVGDVTTQLNQMTVASSGAAIAATAIFNKLKGL